jgi:16S rRNA (uracil1498-N3)-methyltransferase
VLFAIDHPQARPLASIQADIPANHPVSIFIGPEGGWSESEIDFARRNDYTFAWLGPRRLRAETAAALAVGAMASLQA